VVVFVIVYGAQESIPRNRSRKPVWFGVLIRKIGLTYWPARLGIDSWAPKMDYKYGLRFPATADAIVSRFLA
jgi:hypothetical protein